MYKTEQHRIVSCASGNTIWMWLSGICDSMRAQLIIRKRSIIRVEDSVFASYC
jgi:hypothetical protein